MLQILERTIIALGLSVFVVAIGCGVVSTVGSNSGPKSAMPQKTRYTMTQPAELAEGLPYRAIGIQLQRTDYLVEYKQMIDEIADVGADTVKFVVDARMENGTSSRIFLDMRMTPSSDMLGTLIRYAKGKNLRVILMPIVLLDKPRGDEWRGTIKPDNWDDWWESYRDMLFHFLWISQSNGVDVFVIGSELVSTETEQHLPEWHKTIDLVRREFKGQITYSANWDHYKPVKFWDRLDFIGMNSYWKMGKDKNASIDEITASWRTIQENVFAFVREQRKPLMILEVGWCSLDNAASEPWDYTQTTSPVNLKLQERLYEGFFQSWHGQPNLAGYSIWEWTVGEGGPDDKTYTPEAKPAEQVLRRWIKRPWNE
jgi:hypothetical protein